MLALSRELARYRSTLFAMLAIVVGALFLAGSVYSARG